MRMGWGRNIPMRSPLIVFTNDAFSARKPPEKNEHPVLHSKISRISGEGISLLQVLSTNTIAKLEYAGECTSLYGVIVELLLYRIPVCT
jgi:hypothetical protein